MAVDGPVYLRMKRPDGIGSGVRAGPIEAGKGEVIRRGPDGVVVACGLMVAAAVKRPNSSRRGESKLRS